MSRCDVAVHELLARRKDKRSRKLLGTDCRRDELYDEYIRGRVSGDGPVYRTGVKDGNCGVVNGGTTDRGEVRRSTINSEREGGKRLASENSARNSE